MKATNTHKKPHSKNVKTIPNEKKTRISIYKPPKKNVFNSKHKHRNIFRRKKNTPVSTTDKRYFERTHAGEQIFKKRAGKSGSEINFSEFSHNEFRQRAPVSLSLRRKENSSLGIFPESFPPLRAGHPFWIFHLGYGWTWFRALKKSLFITLSDEFRARSDFRIKIRDVHEFLGNIILWRYSDFELFKF